jgi:hypothetical protein
MNSSGEGNRSARRWIEWNTTQTIRYLLDRLHRRGLRKWCLLDGLSCLVGKVEEFLRGVNVSYSNAKIVVASRQALTLLGIDKLTTKP